VGPKLRSKIIPRSAILDADPAQAEIVSSQGPGSTDSPAQTEVSAPALNAPARKPALPALSGLRTILAVNVMFFHFTPPHPDFLSPIIDNAYVFVGFFFLISGFVLAYNYADRPKLSKRAFYVARISRVYPVYLLVLLLSIPFLSLEWQAHSPQDFFTGLVLTPIMLQSWIPPLATFWNTVAWTVPAEIVLYLLFPYLLHAIEAVDARLGWFKTPLRIFATILVLWVIGITPHTLYHLFNPDHLTEPATRYTYASWLRFIKYSPAAYVCTFTAGVFVARLHGRLSLTPRQRTFIAGVALFSLGLFFAFAVEHIPYVIVHGCLLLPIFAALLLGLAGVNPVSTVFAWKPIVLFGETTFALYLLHFNTLMLVQYWKLPQLLHLQALDPWISFAFVMVLAWIVSRFYEKPARKLVQTWLSPAA
jgi:peptidoglycan/LPS O-acetylase OafA/YrhL